jgi:hypothetical protein
MNAKTFYQNKDSIISFKLFSIPILPENFVGRKYTGIIC